MSKLQIECLELNLQTSTEYFGRFLIKNVPYGHGITIGNLLRRVLLTSLPGLSIIGARIAGTNSEFSTIPGVREDVLEILLNFKELIFKQNEKSVVDPTCIGRLKVQGPAIVTASRFILPKNIDLINPNQYLATIADNSILEMEIKLARGVGYSLAEDRPRSIGPLNFLELDAVFMPVRKVVYQVHTNLIKTSNVSDEQITLDIWTNGTILPSDAIALAATEILTWLEPMYFLDKKPTIRREPVTPTKKSIQDLPLEELNLSARAYNSLKRAKINSTNQLLQYSSKDLKKIKNFGQKSLQEVIQAVKVNFGITIK